MRVATRRWDTGYQDLLNMVNGGSGLGTRLTLILKIVYACLLSTLCISTISCALFLHKIL